ncbi:hypothetical protein BJ912DRAFT_992639 [Pholiota molesta]|nr:hypothetical protein BJ912DRAFT_992609 [Pholiota molesta]KAF8173291.1 hypothetical protein BJ912DRAFT_992639 [Pholiota molesta]
MWNVWGIVVVVSGQIGFATSALMPHFAMICDLQMSCSVPSTWNRRRRRGRGRTAGVAAAVHRHRLLRMRYSCA